MAIDAHKNFAYSLVATAPSPGTSGTSLDVTTGQGSLFPAVPFNATVWPASVLPISTNAEIVRVTNISGDTLTIVRAQEGTSAQNIAIGFQIAATITAKTLTDAEILITEVEVDFGSVPVREKTFTITDARVVSTNKILVHASGNVATGRVGDDAPWDMMHGAALAGTGNFSLFLKADPGPIVGKRKIYYSITTQ